MSTTKDAATERPWSLTANSWRYTTIYDADDTVVCRLDLEDWGVTEDNQNALEKRQNDVAALIVEAVNSHDSLLAKNADLIKALEEANQRLNESGTGEMGLLDTIHATAAIIRDAIGKART